MSSNPFCVCIILFTALFFLANIGKPYYVFRRRSTFWKRFQINEILKSPELEHQRGYQDIRLEES